MTPASVICNVPFSGNLAIDVTIVRNRQAESDDVDNFGGRLRRFRKQLGFTQAEMAAFGGVSTAAQNRYESAGGTEPSVSYFLGLASHQLDVAYLITGERSDSLLDPRSSELVDLFTSAPVAFQEAMLAAARAYASSTATDASDLAGRNARAASSVHDGSTSFRDEGEDS